MVNPDECLDRGILTQFSEMSDLSLTDNMHYHEVEVEPNHTNCRNVALLGLLL